MNTVVTIDIEKYVFAKKDKELFPFLVSIAMSDGEVSDKELQFLYDYGQIYDYESHQVDQMLMSPPTTSNAYSLMPIKQEMLIVDFLLMAFVDESLAEDEYNKCVAYCKQNKLSVVMFDRYLSFFRDNPKKIQKAYQAIKNYRSVEVS